MGDGTKIEWCTTTWSPITGCTPISESCEHCYAKRMANRLRGRYGYPADNPFRVTVHWGKIEEPMKWKKPRRVFVCSMGDIFHDDVPQKAIFSVFAVMMQHPEHTFIVLTKRPERALVIMGLMRACTAYPWTFPGKNIWLGVTAENQQRADERIPILLQIPAVVRFVSVEPMLGPVDLMELPRPFEFHQSPYGWHQWLPKKLHWVICGPETGPGARPMMQEWMHSLHDQCKAAGVPFFMKKEPMAGPTIREFPK